MKTKLILLAIALATTAGVASAGGSLDGAIAAFEKADYRAAIDLATKAEAEDDALAPRARYLAGECHLALGEAEAAEKAFRRVVELRPEAVPAWSGIARALLRQKKTKEAREAATRAVELDAKDAEAQRTLGEAYLAEKNEAAAKKPLEAAYKLDRKDPRTVRALFEYHFRGDRIDKAAAIAQKLSKDVAQHPMGWFLRGVAADRAGDDDEAIAHYEKAIALDDTFIDAHKNLAILCTAKNPLYRNKERTDKALAHYERYFALGGEDPELERVYKTIKSFLAQSGGR